jgi:hypothetical protein
MSSNEDKDIKEPVLVCRKISSGKILHVDPGFCKRRFGFFGQWVPKFECGDKSNHHTCELMSQYDLEHISKHDKNSTQNDLASQ